MTVYCLVIFDIYNLNKAVIQNHTLIWRVQLKSRRKVAIIQLLLSKIHTSQTASWVNLNGESFFILSSCLWAFEAKWWGNKWIPYAFRVMCAKSRTIWFLEINSSEIRKEWPVSVHLQWHRRYVRLGSGFPLEGWGSKSPFDIAIIK